MSTAQRRASGGPRVAAANAHAQRSGRVGSLLHVFLIAIALLWLFPLLWAVYTSLRPYGETASTGYVSIGEHAYSLDNYVNAWNDGQLADVLPEHARSSSSRRSSSSCSWPR